MTYDLCITAVSERADLFVESVESLLGYLDEQPACILVHEDVRAPYLDGQIAAWLERATREERIESFTHRVCDPNRGMGAGMLWCFEQSEADIILYSQEDWKAVRDIPVRRALELMTAHGLNHIRFNKRKTMRSKHADTDHPWHKLEVVVGGQMLCVADHWYTQTSLWRREAALPNLHAALAGTGASSEKFVARFNTLMNQDAQLTARDWNDQQLRHARSKTYIWGPVGEPAFIRHIGSERGTGTIRDHRGA